LSIDELQREKQVEQRDNLAAKIRPITDVISEPLVIEVLAEVIRQSERHPRTDQVASSLAGKGLPITEKDVADVFDYYEIEKKTLDSR
jgi:hypothetical protein